MVDVCTHTFNTRTLLASQLTLVLYIDSSTRAKLALFWV